MSQIENKLIITKQPPKIWYNQQGGKQDFFEVGIIFQSNDQVQIPILLKIKLLYDTNQLVDNQNILQLIDTPIIKNIGKEEIIKIRINDISKNHMKKLFILDINIVDIEINSIKTLPILIKSKQTKSSRISTPFLYERNPKQQRTQLQHISPTINDKISLWSIEAMKIFITNTWMIAGFESYINNVTGILTPDYTRNIYRCISCGNMRSHIEHLSESPFKGHRENCNILNLAIKFKSLNIIQPNTSITNESDKYSISAILNSDN